MEVGIRVFRAPEDPETCNRFIEGHHRLLEIHFGIAKITSADSKWVDHENTYVIVAESADRQKIFGGARVQVADGLLQLPIQTAIGKYDPSIHKMVENGVSEICGLWNSTEVAGFGIGSIFLGRAAVVVGHQLNVSKLFLLCAPITARLGKRVGAVVETSLGNKGNFFYPKDGFIATAMSINDCETLVHADDKERNRIFDLYENPKQFAVERGPRGDLSVNYELQLCKHIKHV